MLQNRIKTWPCIGILFLFLLSGFMPVFAEDLVFENVYEYAGDLPRIYYLLKRSPSGNPIYIDGEFPLNYAFLDTGASGILISAEMADVEMFDLNLDPYARYVDTGVGGDEEFYITEPLYIATAGFETEDPENPSAYSVQNGPWRFQVKENFVEAPDEPLDILGIPVMAGNVVILHPGATNELEFFAANIVHPGDPSIPPVDFKVAVRFEKFITPDNSGNIPPLPVLAYNPLIDNVSVTYGGQAVSGSWLLDTCGSISLICSDLAYQLGLVDEFGDPLVTPFSSLPVGGIGSSVVINMFEVPRLEIPTLSGFKLVYENARIGVHDIGVYDETTGQYKILDGIFGSNFLCLSAAIDPESFWPLDFSATPYNWIVLDTVNGTLGFDVYDEYPLPTANPSVCGGLNNPWPVPDINRDCQLDILDLALLADSWLADCDALNGFCQRADINRDGTANLPDFAQLFQF